jgi:hypothetical protein
MSKYTFRGYKQIHHQRWGLINHRAGLSVAEVDEKGFT